MFVMNNRKSSFRRNVNMFNSNENKRNREQEISFMMNKYNNDNINDITKNNNETPKIKEMIWGEPTWIFFHTLAEKVREENFSELKTSLLNYITRICNNLPCPECTQHASHHLKTINYDTIQTKEQFKHMLWSFHNMVNKRKGFVLFPYDELNKKYSKAVTLNIIRNFFYHYSRKQYNVRLSMDNLTRRNILKEMQQWLEKNANMFYP